MRNMLSSVNLPAVREIMTATTADKMNPITSNAARMNILSAVLVFLKIGNVIMIKFLQI